MNNLARSRPVPKALALLALIWLLATAVVAPARADSWHYSGQIWTAQWVDLEHPGIHTHANSIGFDLKRIYIPPKATQIHVVGHCLYSTWVPGWGSIENWVVNYSGSSAVVVVPSRFADLVYVSPLQPIYWSTWPYYADVWWYGP